MKKLRPTDENPVATFFCRKQKQSESATEFALKVEELARRAFKENAKKEDILQVFWGGLSAEIKRVLATNWRKPETMDEAIEAAKTAERY